jgi:hypothetical protein
MAENELLRNYELIEFLRRKVMRLIAFASMDACSSPLGICISRQS